MPLALSYPGVYVEEIPSGVHTIVGVATSITAFIGRAESGPTDKAVTIFGFGEYQRTFGGYESSDTARDHHFAMAYAVRDFFQNGGGQAVIVRIAPRDGTATAAKIAVGDLKFVAADPGSWGNKLVVKIDRNVSDEAATALGPGITKDDLFNLTVAESFDGGQNESYSSLTVKDTIRRVDRVLLAQSNLLRWDSSVPFDPVPASPATPFLTTSRQKRRR